MIRFFASLLVSSLPTLVIAQIISGEIVDDSNNNQIPYATVYNLNNQSFTYSDEYGRFKVPAKLQDTLLIRHLGYKPMIVPIDSSTVRIVLRSEIVKLAEVVVSNKVVTSSLGYEFKKNHLYGIKANTDYALLIRNTLKDEGVIKKLTIPIKIKKGYSNQGLLLLQFFKSTPDGKVSSIPFSEKFDVVIEPKKEIELTFDDPIPLPNEDFYVVFKRVIPNVVFKDNSPSLSLNPFFYSTRPYTGNNSQGLLFIKDQLITKGEWMKADAYYSLFSWNYMPVFNLKLSVETFN